LHARACDAGVADPLKLAHWMVKFRFADQDFFEVDLVRYASALGEVGLAAYREAVAGYKGADSFAVRYARERLAILDVDVIVKPLGGDLKDPYQFIRVAEAIGELALDDEVLAWSKRGIAQTSGWQISQLYDLACGVHAKREQPLEVLALRREQHERMPSSSTYRALRTAAEALGAWPVEQDAARATLQRADLRGFVDALLADGATDAAWNATVAGPRMRSGQTYGCDSRRPASRAIPPTPSPSTNGSPTRRWNEPTAGHTAPPHGSSSAHRRPRRPPPPRTSSRSTSRACASSTGDDRP
jgi:hypothetical protein